MESFALSSIFKPNLADIWLEIFSKFNIFHFLVVFPSESVIVMLGELARM